MRLNVLVEGQTEEALVRHVLAPHLGNIGVFPQARRVYTSRKRGRKPGSAARWVRGGMSTYQRAKRDLFLWMKEDPGRDARFTTMFDLYALPSDFPGTNTLHTDPLEKARAIEAAVLEDIGLTLDNRRFLPYLQVHEFEALLLVDPSALDGMYPGHSREIQKLAEEAMGFLTPEHINLNDPPSRRIRRLIPGYNKVVAGRTAVQSVGLPALRSRCAHFDEWLSRLERLAPADPL